MRDRAVTEELDRSAAFWSRRGVMAVMVALSAGSVAGAPRSETAPACQADRVTLISGIRQSSFTVELARTPEEQARGLMFRPFLPRDAGMLFIMEPPRLASFWMRNTMISLDLVFIDRAGRVVNVAARAVPYSEAPLRSEGEVRAVLEINGGLAEALGIGPGTRAVHPVFDAAPAPYRCAG
ncbi:MAG: DUF192 domain-containing protein [Pseudomonadota bacterium]